MPPLMQGSKFSGTISRLRNSKPGLRFAAFREAVSETSQPTLLRSGGSTTGTPNDGGATATSAPALTQCPSCKGAGIANGTLCARCSGAGTIPTGADVPSLANTSVQESTRGVGDVTAPVLVRLAPQHSTKPIRLREADADGTGPVYEVELVAEGLGNERDRVFYTSQALREAVSSDVFAGMQAYANHPGKDEEINRPERDVRELVGYYRGFKFKESGSLGKPVVTAELVVNKGDSSQWFVDLMESAIAAKADGVQLCGISIDGGGLVELGEIDGQHVNVCRRITEAASADIVTRPAAGGTIVKRLRESVQRAQLPDPTGGTVKIKAADIKAKLGTAHTALRESVAKLTADGATDEQVAEALTGLTGGIKQVEELAGAEIEAEVSIREAQVGDKTAAEIAKERDELQVKLRESEAKVGTLTGEKTALERSMWAAQALREAEVPTEQAKHWFADLAKLDSLEAMQGAITSRKSYEDQLFERFRESVGLGAVEGVPALVPTPAPAGGGQDALEAAGIPTLPAPAAS